MEETCFSRRTDIMDPRQRTVHKRRIKSRAGQQKADDTAHSNGWPVRDAMR